MSPLTGRANSKRSKGDRLTCLPLQERSRARYLQCSIAAFCFGNTSSNNSRVLPPSQNSNHSAKSHTAGCKQHWMQRRLRRDEGIEIICSHQRPCRCGQMSSSHPDQPPTSITLRSLPAIPARMLALRQPANDPDTSSRDRLSVCLPSLA